MDKMQHFGVMLDCSRNGVMRPEQVMRFIDCLRKMGYNTLELYTEDTFAVDGEPYFGYLRGGYTRRELHEIDEYAAKSGIELIPCIQTLAHLTNPAKLPHFREIIDIDDILLIDEEKTYAFLDRVFASLKESFSSRNVHIGMDEAHLIGLGKYLERHGYVNRAELLSNHLNRVLEIARKYGFTAHMWSDMFFRLFHGGVYQARDVAVSDEMRNYVPKDVELVYWDYFHDDIRDFDDMFAAHAELRRNVWFAGGAWSWNGFAPMSEYSLRTMQAAMQSVNKFGIRDVLITMWGDNGKECSFFSLLPVLYAVRRFADGEFDRKKIADEFGKLFPVSFDDFMALELPNSTVDESSSAVENPCKSLLYADCLMGIYDYAVSSRAPIPFGQYADKLAKLGKCAGEYGYIYRCLSALCSVLEIKADLGVRTRNAYKAKDTAELVRLAKNDYTLLEKRLADFYNAFKTLWFIENKPQGFEVHDVRMGGLLMRVRSCKERLINYSEQRIQRIEELEEDILPYDGDVFQNNFYRHIVSTSEL